MLLEINRALVKNEFLPQFVLNLGIWNSSDLLQIGIMFPRQIHSWTRLIYIRDLLIRNFVISVAKSWAGENVARGAIRVHAPLSWSKFPFGYRMIIFEKLNFTLNTYALPIGSRQIALFQLYTAYFIGFIVLYLRSEITLWKRKKCFQITRFKVLVNNIPKVN